MPVVNINAEVVEGQAGPSVIVSINGKQIGGMGPFENWHVARGEALTLTDGLYAAAERSTREFFDLKAKQK